MTCMHSLLLDLMCYFVPNADLTLLHVLSRTANYAIARPD